MFKTLAKWSLSVCCLFPLTGCNVGPDGLPLEDDVVAVATSTEALSTIGVPTPDLALELAGCETDPAKVAERVATLRRAAVSALKSVDLARNGHGDGLTYFDYNQPGSALVLNACRNGRHIFGAWFTRAVGISDTIAARAQVLSELELLGPNESFALRLSPGAAATLTALAFNDVEKRWDTETNKPSPTGDLRFTRASTTFPASNAAMLDLRGYYRLIMENGFDALVKDTVTINGASWLQCSTSHTVDVDVTAVTWLHYVFNAAGDLNTLLGVLVSRGPLCRAIDGIEQDTLIPNSTLKTVFQVSRVAMSPSTGANVGGNVAIAVRNPTLAITGDFSLVAEADEPASGVFSVRTDDLRAPITYSWSSPNATVSGTGGTVTVTWTLGSGVNFNRALTVTATDADGRTLTQTRTVGITRNNVLD
ncbi:MAG: hypothetical protein ACOZQL_04720 [Myxococcota bacterium]